MKKPKMNEMAEIAKQSKAFRDCYQNKVEDQQKMTATFFKNKEYNLADKEIEMIMEWFSNQRFPNFRK